MDIKFRDATPEDVEIVAKTFLMAIEWDRPVTEELLGMCLREDSLYSWRRTRIAEADGKSAGCLIAYPGEEYAVLRERTWSIFKSEATDSFDGFEPETYRGEFYLDSLAVLPEFRGHGIGRQLLLDGVRKGQALGYRRITLIAETDHPHLRQYYEETGFKPFAEMDFFGHRYTRMIFNNPNIIL